RGRRHEKVQGAEDAQEPQEAALLLVNRGRARYDTDSGPERFATQEDPLMADSKTILIVDDDTELSDGLRLMLERQGYRVLQARDGQQGKSLIYQHRPDLVILDMMMPRMGGYPVLEHFRGKTDAPPIIMITAN